MQIVTGRRGEPHVTSRQVQAVYRSFLGDFALLDIGNHLGATATANDNVRISDGVVAVQGIYAVIAYNEYDDNYIEPVSVGMKRIDTLILHYTKSNDIEDMQIEVVEGEEVVDNPVAPTIAEGGDAWEGTADIKVPIYDVLVTSFGLTVTPYSRMNTLIPTLDSIAERIPEHVVTGIKGDSEESYRYGNVNLTKDNIGLGNVDNTADTDKPISTATQTALNLKADLTYVDAKISAAYHAGGSKTVAELTSSLLIADNMGKVYNMSDSGVTTSDFVEGAGEPINEGDNVGICNVGTEETPVYKFDLLSGFVDLSNYVTTTAMNTALADKVDKVAGKGLSTEDYTTEEKTKLAGIEAQANKTVVDSSMSTTSTNPLQNKVITAELAGTKTTQGNPITVTNAAPVNAVDVSVDVEPIQDLHGYDHPWVGGAGKNKLPMTVDGIKSVNTQGTWNGNVYSINNVTFEILTDSDNNVTGIQITGTPSSRVELLITSPGFSTNVFKGMLLNGGTGITGIYNGIYVSYSNNGINWEDEQFQTDGDVTIRNYNYINITIMCSTETFDTVVYPMIRLSTETDSSFAPYTNICPISGRSEVEIDRVGVNLFDETTATDGYRFGSDGSPFAQSGYSISDYIRVNKSTAYVRDKSMNTNECACLYDSNKGFIDRITTGKTFQTTSATCYVRLSMLTTDKDTTQFEKGTEPTTYEPYKGKTYTIQFGQTVYGGTLDATKGELVVDRTIKLVSECIWYGSNGVFYTDEAISTVKKGDGRFDRVISSVYETYNIGLTPPLPDGGIAVDVNGHIQLKDMRYTSASDFKTAMNGVQLVYELATPITIQLTPQQIKLLENTNTLYTDYEGDTITIEYQPNNAIGEAVRVVEESYDSIIQNLLERIEALENNE